MKPAHVQSFSGDRHEPTGEGTSERVGHLIPLVDEIDRVMTVTCRYCGATAGPLEITEDGGDYVVPLVAVFHVPSCPLVLDVQRH